MIEKSIDRLLKISLPRKQSAFLWGPRKTGKSTFLKENFSRSLSYDLLKRDLYLELVKTPSLFREQLLAKNPQQLAYPVIVDEVQKVPALLDEIHYLIENHQLQFILCGSSARKLKRGQANLLGGRAWRYELHPLVSQEVKNFNLLRALNQGLIPAHYLQESEDAKKSLSAYVQDYLKEEVFEEGLVRNIPAFSRFFEAFSFSHGEMIQYANIARDCGIDAKTVREYFQILVDTLLGTWIPPFKRVQNRQVITKASKFYLFDVGVAGAITKRHFLEEEKGELFGRAFEHFILMELLGYRAYHSLDFDIHFWRTKTGLEVDFILGTGETAIEVKGSGRVDTRDLKSLQAFKEEHAPKKTLLVCNEKTARKVGEIQILPWREFLDALWNRKFI